MAIQAPVDAIITVKGRNKYFSLVRNSYSQCEYEDVESPCRRCTLHGLPCGEKLLGPRTDALKVISKELMLPPISPPLGNPTDPIFTPSELGSFHRLFHVLNQYGPKHEFRFNFLPFEPAVDTRDSLRSLNFLSFASSWKAIRYAALAQCASFGFSVFLRGQNLWTFPSYITARY